MDMIDDRFKKDYYSWKHCNLHFTEEILRYFETFQKRIYTMIFLNKVKNKDLQLITVIIYDTRILCSLCIEYLIKYDTSLILM